VPRPFPLPSLCLYVASARRRPSVRRMGYGLLFTGWTLCFLPRTGLTQSACSVPGTRSGSWTTARPDSDTLWRSPRGGTIVGEVVDIDGSAISRAVIRVRGPLPDRDEGRGGVSDESGVFTIPNVKPARYEMEVRAVGYLYQRHELLVIPAGADTICLRLRASKAIPGPARGQGSHRQDPG
jgi:hypothetical protein